MSSSDRPKVEYDSESELVEDYKLHVTSSSANLQIATEYLYDSLVSEAVMGIAFQMHFESKFPVSLRGIFIDKFHEFRHFPRRKFSAHRAKNPRSTAPHPTTAATANFSTASV
jgi:hypothetical protein